MGQGRGREVWLGWREVRRWAFECFSWVGGVAFKSGRPSPRPASEGTVSMRDNEFKSKSPLTPALSRGERELFLV